MSPAHINEGPRLATTTETSSSFFSSALFWLAELARDLTSSTACLATHMTNNAGSATTYSTRIGRLNEISWRIMDTLALGSLVSVLVRLRCMATARPPNARHRLTTIIPLPNAPMVRVTSKAMPANCQVRSMIRWTSQAMA